MKNILLSLSLCATLVASCATAADSHNNDPAIGPSTTQPQGTHTLQLDGVKVTWIQDNTADKLMERSLFSDAPDTLIDRLGLAHGIPSTISVFWVEVDGKGILFDTGNGDAMTCRLARLGISPVDVSYIYLTHLHGDHIGGMLSDTTAVFPNAQVYVSRIEYEAWMAMRSKAARRVGTVMRAYSHRLHLFEIGDTLPGGVATIDATGHTPGHTAYQVGNLLIIGDLMHGAALQMPYPQYCANFDMDKPQAIDARCRLLRYATEKALVMAGMHLPAPAFIMPQ